MVTYIQAIGGLERARLRLMHDDDAVGRDASALQDFDGQPEAIAREVIALGRMLTRAEASSLNGTLLADAMLDLRIPPPPN